MSSPAQVAANQANAQHSTGAQTAEGKARVAMNPIHHGLAAAKIFLPGEEPEEFVALQTSISDSYKCVHSGDAALVNQAALASWKLRRINEWQAEIMTACLTGQEMPEPLAKMFGPSPDAALKTLHRYEVSAHGVLNRSLNHLRILKKERDSSGVALAKAEGNAAIDAFEKLMRSDLFAPNRANPISTPATPTSRPVDRSAPPFSASKSPWSR